MNIFNSVTCVSYFVFIIVAQNLNMGDMDDNVAIAQLEECKRRINESRHIFRLSMEYEFGLNDLIASKDILHPDDIEILNGLTENRSVCNTKLTTLILEIDKLNDMMKLVAAFNSTDQSHLAGIIVTEPYAEIPLTDDQYTWLRRNRSEIVNKITPYITEINETLNEKNSISADHYESVKCKTDDKQKARTLISIAERRSVEQLRDFWNVFINIVPDMNVIPIFI